MSEYYNYIIDEIESKVSFPIDIEGEDYPDVLFNVVFECRPDDSMIEKTVSALERYMYDYNKIHFFRPIHYVSDIKDVSFPNVFSACIHMDFGSANPRSLIGAVLAIAKTNCPIYRIILE